MFLDFCACCRSFLATVYRSLFDSDDCYPHIHSSFYGFLYNETLFKLIQYPKVEILERHCDTGL